jgi:hypothetical protein
MHKMFYVVAFQHFVTGYLLEVSNYLFLQEAHLMLSCYVA